MLNIADVLAYQFHKNICKRSEEERRKEAVAMGESFDPNLPAKDYLPFGKSNPLKIMANNQLITMKVCLKIINTKTFSPSY